MARALRRADRARSRCSRSPVAQPTTRRANSLGDVRAAGNLDQSFLEPGLQRFDERLGFCCRTARRCSALLPRISASI